jgi:hypothetical protein
MHAYRTIKENLLKNLISNIFDDNRYIRGTPDLRPKVYDKDFMYHLLDPDILMPKFVFQLF